MVRLSLHMDAAHTDTVSNRVRSAHKSILHICFGTRIRSLRLGQNCGSMVRHLLLSAESPRGKPMHMPTAGNWQQLSVDLILISGPGWAHGARFGCIDNVPRNLWGEAESGAGFFFDFDGNVVRAMVRDLKNHPYFFGRIVD